MDPGTKAPQNSSSTTAAVLYERPLAHSFRPTREKYASDLQRDPPVGQLHGSACHIERNCRPALTETLSSSLRGRPLRQHFHSHAMSFRPKRRNGASGTTDMDGSAARASGERGGR